MSLPFDLERELGRSVRQARLVTATCCYFAPIMYLFSFGTQILGGRWQRFFTGFGALDWRDRRVLLALAVAAAALALAVALPPRVGHLTGGRRTLAVLRGRNLLGSGLLVAVAVAGLGVGMKVGPSAATLSLGLCLIPIVRGFFIFPSESRWRAAAERAEHPANLA